MKVLFAAFEASPFAKTGGLGDVAGSLPAALNECGAEVRLIMPKLSCIPSEYRMQMRHLDDFYIDLAWRHQFCGIEVLEYNGVICYFIDNEYYFYRDGVYGFGDDTERAAFFSLAVIESLNHIDFQPDIIHSNDWHTALIPVFMKIDLTHAKSVFTVHNLKFQGIIPSYDAGDLLAISYNEACELGLVYDDTLNFMRGALCCADQITTVSPTYATEICTDTYGEKCQDIFNSRRNCLTGILNGIDISTYPITCSKGEAKQNLQTELGLDVRSNVPIYAIISRLSDQKGLDLVLETIDRFMANDVQLVILGVGEYRYEEKFRQMARFMPGKVSANILFDEALSKRIYAGADFILMPSIFEPCGLSQIIGMHYGTVPIVRRTGGLADTVTPETGFSFNNADSGELFTCMMDSLNTYHSAAFSDIVAADRNARFTWEESARAYIDVYDKARL